MICQVCSPLRDIGRLGRKLSQTARLMVGQPDYDGYVAHRRATHPDEPVMTREEFFLERQNRRFGGGPNGTFRCC